jgi:hypothetical protein
LTTRAKGPALARSVGTVTRPRFRFRVVASVSVVEMETPAPDDQQSGHSQALAAALRENQKPSRTTLTSDARPAERKNGHQITSGAQIERNPR